MHRIQKYLLNKIATDYINGMQGNYEEARARISSNPSINNPRVAPTKPMEPVAIASPSNIPENKQGMAMEGLRHAQQQEYNEQMNQYNQDMEAYQQEKHIYDQSAYKPKSARYGLQNGKIKIRLPFTKVRNKASGQVREWTEADHYNDINHNELYAMYDAVNNPNNMSIIIPSNIKDPAQKQAYIDRRREELGKMTNDPRYQQLAKIRADMEVNGTYTEEAWKQAADKWYMGNMQDALYRDTDHAYQVAQQNKERMNNVNLRDTMDYIDGKTSEPRTSPSGYIFSVDANGNRIGGMSSMDSATQQKMRETQQQINSHHIKNVSADGTIATMKDGSTLPTAEAHNRQMMFRKNSTPTQGKITSEGHIAPPTRQQQKALRQGQHNWYMQSKQQDAQRFNTTGNKQPASTSFAQQLNALWKNSPLHGYFNNKIIKDSFGNSISNAWKDLFTGNIKY